MDRSVYVKEGGEKCKCEFADYFIETEVKMSQGGKIIGKIVATL